MSGLADAVAIIGFLGLLIIIALISPSNLKLELSTRKMGAFGIVFFAIFLIGIAMKVAVSR